MAPDGSLGIAPGPPAIDVRDPAVPRRCRPRPLARRHRPAVVARILPRADAGSAIARSGVASRPMRCRSSISRRQRARCGDRAALPC
jgi:hypothetical protein